MNKKRNRTVSRKKIQNAVVELLKNSNLENLKVTKICQKAHINRSTFYDNYTDIYDMADKLRKYLVDEYALTQNNSKKPIFSKLLQHVKDNQDLYRLFFKLNLQDGVAEKFIDSHEEKNHYDEVFFRNGIAAIITEWLKNNCSEPIDNVVKVIDAHQNCLQNNSNKY